MCDPVSASLVLAGMGTQYYAQDQAAGNRKQAIGRAQDWQDTASRKIIDTSMTNAKQYDPTARMQANTQAQDAATNSLRGYLEAAKPQQPDSSVNGAVSSTFNTDRAQRTLADANRATMLARLFGKVRGATDLRAIEGLNNADAASRVASMARNKANMAGAQNVDIQEAGTPDPTLMLLGSLMTGYGMGGLRGGAAPATPPQYLA